MKAGIAVIPVRCRNPPELADFFSRALQLPVLKRGEGHAVLGCIGVSLEFIPGKGGGQDIQFEVDSIEEAVSHLRSSGIEPEDIDIGLREDGSIAQSAIGETFWGRFARVRDPEGNLITVTEHDVEWFPFMPRWFREGWENVSDKETTNNRH